MIPLKELFRCQVPGTFVGGIPRKKIHSPGAGHAGDLLSKRINRSDVTTLTMSHYTATCHCERSEAISEYLGDGFGAKSAPRNDKCDIVEAVTIRPEPRAPKLERRTITEGGGIAAKSI
jgi:hypothetical protein